MKEILQLKVSLVHSKPLIWRQVLVRQDITFSDLHQVLQIAMGWDNTHLFEFDLQGYRIGIVDEREKNMGYGSDQVLDSKTVKINDIVTASREVFKYLYDFGDGWAHHIKVEKSMAPDKDIIYPLCLDGEMNCPPEDCGGIHFFYHCLEVLKDKKHPEYKFIAQQFDKNTIPTFSIRKRSTWN
ncbi:plasmid pRiA4b ORF-3 family protein [Paraflavitalea speifideaquila]|uniref:plasmid pRiA4b ORF-3 family protein n=1 Tax=Paraflavitalea speifideaquila TaxID=3076558 RepID=UPI0028E72FF0|nr:plasmid pRiA4b ORF-3 family protein [Paraflavitalea speifideiaquila]